MYGKRFHKLRLSKNISLVEAYKDITSKSSLARWEHGEGTMDADKATKLIERLGINPSEFFTFEYDSLTNRINEAGFKNDEHELLELAQLAIRKLHDQPASFINLFNAGVASNSYFILTRKLILPQKDLNRLLNVLFNTSFWSQEKIDLFGGSILLIPSDKILSLSKRIIAKMERIKKISDAQFFNTMGMLLNAVLALIEQKQPNFAVAEYKLIDRIYISEDFASLILRKKFYYLIIKFLESMDEGNLDMYFKVLNYLGLEKTSFESQQDLKQIKQIYNIA